MEVVRITNLTTAPTNRVMATTHATISALLKVTTICRTAPSVPLIATLLHLTPTMMKASPPWRNQHFLMTKSQPQPLWMILFLNFDLSSWLLMQLMGASHSIFSWRVLLNHGSPFLPAGTNIDPDPQGSHNFTTKTSTLTTNTIVHLKVQFPDLAPGHHFNSMFSFHMHTRPNTSSAAILGCDMLRHLQIQFDFFDLTTSCQTQ
jgi:hypothetical protein